MAPDNFRPFCYEPVDTANSPRRYHAASMAQSGSSNDHPKLRVFSQFGPGAENYDKAIVIHKKPRYPPEVALIKEYRQLQETLADAHSKTETLPRPPSGRYALPHPNALLTTIGSARDAQSIIRQCRQDAVLNGSVTAAVTPCSAAGAGVVCSASTTISGTWSTSGGQLPEQRGGDLPMVTPPSSNRTSPRVAPRGGAGSVQPSPQRDRSPCHPALPSLFRTEGSVRCGSNSRQHRAQRPLVVLGIEKAAPTTPRVESSRQFSASL